MKDKIQAQTIRTTSPIPTLLHEKLQASLPLLPGHSFDLHKQHLQNHRKSHAFDYCNQTSVFKNEAPGIGGTQLINQKDVISTSIDIYKHDESAERVPAWVAFDRKVLRFYGYFTELVHERREEDYRVRKVNIYFYLEDDTIHVSEPRLSNSGIPQGTLLRRHRIPKSENGQHFIVSDLNVGKSVEFYSRCFTITGCDEFTKTFLELNGINVPNPSSIPLDPYTLVRNELASRMKPRKAYLPKSSLKKFLENDRRVLRFYCVWDDTNSMFGDVRDMVLHYFLSDDTIEIKEAIPANSGRQGNTLFLRRCKLPKKSQLEAMGGGDDKDEYYNETDLVLGSILHLHGRPFVICNCDDFTREYYLENYGLEHLDPVQFEGNDVGKEHEYDEEISFFAKMQDTNSPSSLVPNILAHNTTREAVLKDPKPVKYDFKRMIKFDGVSLRFSSVLVSSKQIDKDRKFIVVLYPADDTIGVFEPKQRNSGIIGGKFMEKKKVLKPDQVHWYSSSDFFVGGRLVLHGHEFELTGCDEFSTGFMKREPLLFRS